jgi:hypothetical protein
MRATPLVALDQAMMRAVLLRHALSQAEQGLGTIPVALPVAF